MGSIFRVWVKCRMRWFVLASRRVMKGPDMELSKIAENDETENEGVFGGFFVIQKMDRDGSDVPSYYGRFLCGEADEAKSESQPGALS